METAGGYGGGAAARVGVVRVAGALACDPQASDTCWGAGRGAPHGSVGGACWAPRGMPQGSVVPAEEFMLVLLMSSKLSLGCA